MLEVSNLFQGNFSVNCQQKSIPFPLVSLCSLLIDGADQGADPKATDVIQAANVSQLIMFSYKKQYKIVQINETSLAIEGMLKNVKCELKIHKGRATLSWDKYDYNAIFV